MGFAEMVVLVTGIGCATGIAAMLIDKLSSRGREQARLRDERLRQLELENEQLRQQIEWQSRLLTGSPTQSASRLQS
jgi:hypothetical protein